MARLLQDQHYVNFLRGTPAAWERLKVKDPDTLYFISEKNGTVGQLYLGEKLIAGSLEKITLESIGGIPTADLETGQLLAYNAEKEKWENKTIAEIISPILKIMNGASEDGHGSAGLTPIPQEGDQDKFLRGDGTWASYTLTDEDFNTIISKISSDLYWDNF